MKKFLRFLLAPLAGLALLMALVPAFALAQYTPYFNTTYGNCGNYTYPYTYSYSGSSYSYPYNCQSNLNIFVYVNNWGGSNRSPSDFTLSVTGGNAYPATVMGDTRGVGVRVNGSYSVSAAQFSGFSASYSPGCSGTLFPGQQGICIVTENANGFSGGYPYPYQYQQYPYISSYPFAYNNYTQPAAPVYVNAQFVPSLPNTGFGPIEAGTLALATVLLIAAGIIVTPYVRKAFIAVLS